jgi:hypothetical protein
LIQKGAALAESADRIFHIPPSGLTDLAEVANHAEILEKIIKLSPSSLLEADADTQSISENLGISADAATNILDGLTTLRSLMERQGVGAEQIVDRITKSIETQASERWKSKNYDQWKAAREKLIAALTSIPSDSPLSIRQKATELTYAHEHVLLDSSIVTDLRPVYNAEGDKIHAFVLTHVLSVTYRDGMSSHRIDFALDAADVEKLQQIAVRAILKSKTARAALVATGITLLIPRETPNE